MCVTIRQGHPVHLQSRLGTWVGVCFCLSVFVLVGVYGGVRKYSRPLPASLILLLPPLLSTTMTTVVIIIIIIIIDNNTKLPKPPES